MDAPEEWPGELGDLTLQQVLLLRIAFDQHSVASDWGATVLGFDSFCALASELGLPAAQQGTAAQRRVFDDVLSHSRASVEAIDFEAFRAWVSEARDDNATAVVEGLETEGGAALWGSLARAFTAVTRPVSTVLTQSAAQFHYAATLLAKKCAYAIKSSMQNPTRLFKRKAMNPLEFIKGHPEGFAAALRAELKVGGLKGITAKAVGPWLANSMVAVAMFHTYTTTKATLEGRLALQDRLPLTPLRIEMLAGATAGMVQGTLNAPLYNLKLRQLRGQEAKGGVLRAASHFQRSRGTLAFFRNYPYILAQEGCSLALFFGSYEFFKTQLSQAVRQHVDPSGRKDVFAWALAASASGVVLAGVGTPFENVLEWHVARRDRDPHLPRSVLGHWWHGAQAGSHARILFSGMRKKLPLAPVAGLPLLVYEALVHGGAMPVLHSTE